jgi:hypothetical protein
MKNQRERENREDMASRYLGIPLAFEVVIEGLVNAHWLGGNLNFI